MIAMKTKARVMTLLSGVLELPFPLNMTSIEVEPENRAAPQHSKLCWIVVTRARYEIQKVSLTSLQEFELQTMRPKSYLIYVGTGYHHKASNTLLTKFIHLDRNCFNVKALEMLSIMAVGFAVEVDSSFTDRASSVNLAGS